MKKFVNTLKAAVFYTHTHTHTHTHTGKLLPSIKQIGTICFAISFIIFPNFTFADNITADNITDESTCTNGVLGTYTGPADIEANFDPNTINTTWYSNGTPMTVDSAYQTCTYDAPLTPPTPADRPGYTFGGWKLKPRCLIPSSLVSTNGSSYGFKNDSTGEWGEWSENTSEYGLTDNTWGVTWSNGDKVTGVALCSAHSGDNHSWQWGGNSSDWTSDETTLTSATGGYCWCKATHYTANNAQQCSLSSPAWVFSNDHDSAAGCAYFCAEGCASYVLYGSDFRVALFGGNIAQ